MKKDQTKPQKDTEPFQLPQPKMTGVTGEKFVFIPNLFKVGNERFI